METGASGGTTPPCYICASSNNSNYELLIDGSGSVLKRYYYNETGNPKYEDDYVKLVSNYVSGGSNGFTITVKKAGKVIKSNAPTTEESVAAGAVLTYGWGALEVPLIIKFDA